MTWIAWVLELEVAIIELNHFRRNEGNGLYTTSGRGGDVAGSD